MPKTSKKQTTSRTGPQSQAPASAPCNTPFDIHDVAIQIPSLAVCDKQGSLLCLLDNKPLLPYQKPAVPFCGIVHDAHHLLARLKTAHSFLFLTLQYASVTLPKKFRTVYEIFACTVAYPGMVPTEAALSWMRQRPEKPILVERIGLIDEQDQLCLLDLNLTLVPSSPVDYSNALSRRFFEPLLAAIQEYNAILTEMHKAGAFVVLADFVIPDIDIARSFVGIPHQLFAL